jgi:hypothetical protein
MIGLVVKQNLFTGGVIFLTIGPLFLLLGLYLYRRKFVSSNDLNWESRTILKMIIAGILFVLAGLAMLRFYYG